MSAPTTALPELRLKRHEDKRLRGGHQWVFSNEVDTGATPLRDFRPGQPVTVVAHDGRFVAYGYVNPATLICVRILGRDRRHPPGRPLLVHRLKIALSLRERLFDQPFYRLVHGEGDGLPGLIVDRYGDYLVAQLGTAGMEWLKEELLEALDKVIRPRGVLLRNDTGARDLEGLEREVVLAAGEVPDEVELTEGRCRFSVPLWTGQKTGWFFDQRPNRLRLGTYAAGARVLDLCSYLGGWGVQAAAAGGSELLCVDSSAMAIAGIEANLELNGLAGETLQADAFEAAKELGATRRRFDLVVLDPPAFVKRRKDLKAGRVAYRRLNRLAMKLLDRDGILVTCSCSFHFPEQELVLAVHEAASRIDRQVQVLEFGGQGADHPVHPAIPETRYLKTLFCRVIRP